MTSIPDAPKPILRGNGRDPKSTGRASLSRSLLDRDPYQPDRVEEGQPQPGAPASSPWDAVAYIEQIRELLDTYFGFDYFGTDGIGYSTELDLEYQSLVWRAVSLIDTSPCFEGLWWPDRVLPQCLGHADRGRWWGQYHGQPGRNETFALQSEMVAALVAAGIPRPTAEDQGRPASAVVSGAPTGIAGQLAEPVLPSDTKETVAPRPAKKTGRRPLAISAELIARTYWEMLDEPDQFDTARKRKYSPSQQNVADRLKFEGLGGNPKSMREILKRAGMGWPPPQPTTDD
jgi:hypothetical protein